MKATGNTVFTCKFCGKTFVRYRKGRTKYDYCSHKCAAQAGWAERNARPFPSERELLAFWNNPEHRPFIERTIGSFLSRHPSVPPKEARSEALFIVAKSLRNGRNSHAIMTDIKYGLLFYYRNTYLWQKSLGIYSLDNSNEWRDEICGLVRVEKIISQIEDEVVDARKSTDFNSLLQQINESELKCMRVLAARLRGESNEEIIRSFNLKKDRDVRAYIYSAMKILREREGKGLPESSINKLELHKNEIIKYRAKGLTYAAIAKIYNVTNNDIYYFAKKHNISGDTKLADRQERGVIKGNGDER